MKESLCGFIKMMFREYIIVAFGSASLASAFSLYDTAPMVGTPESQSARYFMSMRGGYDTNPQGTTSRKLRDAGCFVNAALSSTFAEVESVDKVSYTARIGGTRYLGTSGSRGNKYYGDCSLDTSMTHAFSAMSRYTGRLHVSYLPEPGYDNGFSSAGMQGDTLSWSFDNSYSEAIDARWSWHTNVSLSGTMYEEHSFAYDDRQYYSGGFGVNYRESDRLTYTSSVTYREESRSHGMDSRSAFGSVGAKLALDSVSSASASIGAQCKMMANNNTMNPTLDLGYRRRVMDGLSLNAYVKYSDENVDNYHQASRGSYRTSATWRAGAYGTYVLSPDVSYVFRMQVMQTQYRKPTKANMKSGERYTLKPSLSMNYNFTPAVTGTLTAEYTYYHYNRGERTSMYTRWQLSAGMTYRF